MVAIAVERKTDRSSLDDEAPLYLRRWQSGDWTRAEAAVGQCGLHAVRRWPCVSKDSPQQVRVVRGATNLVILDPKGP